MKDHQSSVMTAVWVLAKLVKKTVPDREKLTLEFASDLSKRQHFATKSSRLAKIVQKQIFADSDTFGIGLKFYQALKNTINDIKQTLDKPKHRSIFIMTDGHWVTREGTRDIIGLLKELMDSLSSAGADTKIISITIVRFSRPDGCRYPQGEFVDFNKFVRNLRRHKGRHKSVKPPSPPSPTETGNSAMWLTCF